MTPLQYTRMAEWFEMQGLSPEKVLDCIRYIAGNPDKTEVKNKTELATAPKQNS